MSSYHEAVKRVLSELNKFLESTLPTETLSKATENERGRILKLLQKLFTDYTSLAPSYGDEGSMSSVKDASTDEGRSTVDSCHGSEEDSYADNIPDTTIKALSGSAKMGFLEKRQEKLFMSKWTKFYCILNKNIFYFYKNQADKKQQGAFYITGYDVRDAPQFMKDEKKKELCFELVCPGKKSYQFVSENKDDLKLWRESILAAAVSSGGSNQCVPEACDEIYEDFDETGTKTATIDDPSEAYDDASTEIPSIVSKSASPPATTDHSKSAKGKPEALQVVDDDEIYEVVDSANPPTITNTPDISGIKKKSIDLPPVPTHLSKLPPIPVSAHRPQDMLPPVPSQKEPDAPPLPQRPQDPLNAPPPLPGRSLPPPPKDPLPAVPQTPKKTISPHLGKILRPSEDFENLFYGYWDCAGGTENELSFKRGQILHIISRDLDSDDWWVGALDNKIGLVPKLYLRPAYELVK